MTAHEQEIRAFAERLRSMALVHPDLRVSLLDNAEALDLTAGEFATRGRRPAGYPAVPHHARALARGGESNV